MASAESAPTAEATARAPALPAPVAAPVPALLALPVLPVLPRAALAHVLAAVGAASACSTASAAVPAPAALGACALVCRAWRAAVDAEHVWPCACVCSAAADASPAPAAAGSAPRSGSPAAASPPRSAPVRGVPVRMKVWTRRRGGAGSTAGTPAAAASSASAGSTCPRGICAGSGRLTLLEYLERVALPSTNRALASFAASAPFEYERSVTLRKQSLILRRIHGTHSRVNSSINLLASWHLQLGNFVEAALTVLTQADLYEWSDGAADADGSAAASAASSALATVAAAAGTAVAAATVCAAPDAPGPSRAASAPPSAASFLELSAIRESDVSAPDDDAHRGRAGDGGEGKGKGKGKGEGEGTSRGGAFGTRPRSLDLPTVAHAPSPPPPYTRKEALYTKAVDFFGRSKCWELGIALLQEWRTEFRERPENVVLERDCFSAVKSADRFFWRYYLVEFFGGGVPEFFTARPCMVFKAGEAEPLEKFLQRIQARVRDAVVIREPPTEAQVSDPAGAYIRVRSCQPSCVEEMEGRKRSFPPEMPHIIRAFYCNCNVDVFCTSTSFTKGGGGGAGDSDTRLRWVRNTYLMTKDKFPGTARCSPVVRQVDVDTPPIMNSVRAVKEKTAELKVLSSQALLSGVYRNQFTMTLVGIVDAAVNGGVEMYRKAFFSPAFVQEASAEEVAAIPDLQAALSRQLEALETAIDIHRQVAPKSLAPLCAQLDERFRAMVVQTSAQSIPSLMPAVPPQIREPSRQSIERYQRVDGKLGFDRRTRRFTFVGGRPPGDSDADAVGVGVGGAGTAGSGGGGGGGGGAGEAGSRAEGGEGGAAAGAPCTHSWRTVRVRPPSSLDVPATGPSLSPRFGSQRTHPSAGGGAEGPKAPATAGVRSASALLPDRSHVRDAAAAESVRRSSALPDVPDVAPEPPPPPPPSHRPRRADRGGPSSSGRLLSKVKHRIQIPLRDREREEKESEIERLSHLGIRRQYQSVRTDGAAEEQEPEVGADAEESSVASPPSGNAEK